MVGEGVYVVEQEGCGEFLDLFAAQAVYDACLAGVGLYEFYNLLVYTVGFLSDLIVEVFSVER